MGVIVPDLAPLFWILTILTQLVNNITASYAEFWQIFKIRDLRNHLPNNDVLGKSIQCRHRFRRDNGRMHLVQSFMKKFARLQIVLARLDFVL